MRTRNQIFWATIAIIGAIGVSDSEDWARLPSFVLMAVSLIVVGRLSLRPKKKTSREAHRLR